MTSNISSKQNYLGPFLIMVGLFFIVGFLTVVNQQFQGPLQEAFLKNAGDLKNTLATFITFAFFMGYPAMGTLSSKWIDRCGYRGTLIRGLIILVISLGVFECSAWAESSLGTFNIVSAEIPQAYLIFVVGSFILGCALAVLQAAINPYLIGCVVSGTSDVTRMSIGGSSNSLGTVIAPLFVTYLVFGKNVMPKVDQLYIPFLVLMVTVAIIAVIVSKLNLPDIAGSTAGKEEVLEKSVWSFRHLTFGVIGIFVYVGSEVCIGANISMHGKALNIPEETLTYATSMYWGGLLVGRLLGSFLSKVRGNVQLMVTTIIAIVLITISIITNNPWILVGVGLLHSIMWGAIFSLAVDKLGKYTAKASGALMSGVAGGAVLPWFQGILADVIGNWQFTWCLVLLGEAYLLWYALAGHKHNLKKAL